MSYEHCDIHDRDATNGCAECQADMLMESAREYSEEPRLMLAWLQGVLDSGTRLYEPEWIKIAQKRMQFALGRQVEEHGPVLTAEEHKARHVKLHGALDELVADLIRHTGRRPSQASVLELMKWAHQQALNPTEVPGEETPAKAGDG